MGLLDNMDSDQFRLGLGLLAAGGARSDGMGAGGRIQEAFTGLDQYKRQREVLQYEKLRNEQERQAVIDRKQAQERAAYDEQAIRKQFSPISGGPPTLANAANLGKIPQFNPRQFFTDHPQASMGALKQAMELNQAFNPAAKYETVAPGASVYKMGTNGPELAMTAPDRPEKPDKPPTKVQEFEYAKQNGFKGSFDQYMTLGPSIMAGSMAGLRQAQIGNINAENDYNLPPPRRASNGVSVSVGGRTFSFPDQKSANNFKMKAGVR